MVAAGLSPDVVQPDPLATRAGRAAPRPAYSVLGHGRLHEHGLEPIGPWQERWAVAASEVLGVDQLE